MAVFRRAAVAIGIASSIAAVSSASAIEAAPPAEPQTQQAVALATGGVSERSEAQSSCPKIVVAPDAGVFPKSDDAYKATVEGLARDCANLGAETILKVAVVGEGERDSTSGPSWFNAPLRLAVKDADGKPVETRRISVKVQIPSGLQKVAFNHIEENVSLPPVDGGYAGWTVTVGFDPSAGAAPAKASRARSAGVKRAHVAHAKPVRQPAALPAETPGVGTHGAAPLPPVTTNGARTGVPTQAVTNDAATRPTAAADRRRQQALSSSRAAGYRSPASQVAAADQR